MNHLVLSPILTMFILSLLVPLCFFFLRLWNIHDCIIMVSLTSRQHYSSCVVISAEQDVVSGHRGVCVQCSVDRCIP